MENEAGKIGVARLKSELEKTALAATREEGLPAPGEDKAMEETTVENA
jgi:hypothetical protein